MFSICLDAESNAGFTDSLTTADLREASKLSTTLYCLSNLKRTPNNAHRVLPPDIQSFVEFASRVEHAAEVSCILRTWEQRISRVAKQLLSRFEHQLRSTMDTDTIMDTPLHLHVSFLHPLGGGIRDEEGPSTHPFIAEVVVRDAETVASRWSRLQQSRRRDASYYVKQPLPWTSQEAERYYFGSSSSREGISSSGEDVVPLVKQLLKVGLMSPTPSDGLPSTAGEVRGCDDTDVSKDRSLEAQIATQLLKYNVAGDATSKGSSRKRSRVDPATLEAEGPPPQDDSGLVAVYYISHSGVAVRALTVEPRRIDKEPATIVSTSSEEAASKRAVPTERPMPSMVVRVKENQEGFLRAVMRI